MQRGHATTQEQPDRGSGGEAAHAPVVFVVDDDVGTLQLLCEVAADSGWRSVGFTHLAPLREALGRRRPTSLIIDDELPDGRGGDLVRDLRNDPRLTDIPLLVCTAAPPRRQEEIGSWAPVVAKPFDLGEIEAFLADAARRNGNGDSYGGSAG
jgi:chemosensory pili system protein ChpA (sensor histidine kinase/response regulator)